MRVLITGIVSSVALGFVPHSQDVDQSVRIEIKQEQQTSRSRGMEIYSDAFDGSPSLIQGQLQSADAWHLQALTKQAMQYIEDHQNVFPGLKSQDVYLDKDAVVLNQDLAMLKFRVLRNGRLIKDAAIDFRFNNGQLVAVMNRSFSHVKELSPQRSVAKSNDARKKGEQFRVTKDRDQYKLVPVDVYIEQVDEVPYEVEYYGSEEIMRQSSHHFIKVDAPVYERTYYKQSPVRVPLAGLELQIDSRTTTTDAFGRAQTLDGKKLYLKHLKNSYTNISQGWGETIYYNGEVVNNINIKPVANAPVGGDRVIAQVMPYIHVRNIVDYAKEHLPNIAWFSKQLSVNVNKWSLFMSCNAYWDGWTINFFIDTDECANTSLISDVIYHEWGHGFDANAGGIEDRAFSEGIGDIMSLVMTGSPILGHGFFKDGGAVRRMDVPKIYPQDTGRGPHSEGLIIGSTFYNLLQGLKLQYSAEETQALFAKYSFLMVPAASKYTDVYNALLVIDDDDGDLRNKTPNFCLINDVFSRHGLARKDTSCE
jgi:hypothetical protein